MYFICLKSEQLKKRRNSRISDFLQTDYNFPDSEYIQYIFPIHLSNTCIFPCFEGRTQGNSRVQTYSNCHVLHARS